MSCVEIEPTPVVSITVNNKPMITPNKAGSEPLQRGPIFNSVGLTYLSPQNKVFVHGKI
jgi:hypothetical protein